jgi:hypothetical protein
LLIQKGAEKCWVVSSVAKVMLTVLWGVNDTMVTNPPKGMHKEQQNILQGPEGQSFKARTQTAA